MKKEKWPGVGQRIEQRLRELGYWKGDHPDVIRFSLDHRYVPQFLYKWLKDGITPSRENLLRLQQDLKAPAPWILFGDEVNQPPIPPRKRGRKGLACLLAALGLTTIGMAPAEGGTHQKLDLSAAYAPYQRRRRAFPDTVFLLSAA
jgi:hypothetical protein